MDTKAESPKKGRWDWLPAEMPGVARLMAEKRRKFGAAHVAQCWQRGMNGEAGWFFAREGALAIGTPWPEAGDVGMAAFTAQQVQVGQALIIIKEPEVHHGA